MEVQSKTSDSSSFSNISGEGLPLEKKEKKNGFFGKMLSMASRPKKDQPNFEAEHMKLASVTTAFYNLD